MNTECPRPNCKSHSLQKQIFNLIAQKDSAHLKAIAEEQRRIALAASRDSTSMQVISVITAVFLPATFTAVGRNRPPPPPTKQSPT